MKKIFMILILATGFISFLVFAFSKSKEPKTGTHKGEQVLKITTSFYPLYYLATQIGGNLVDVTNITPAGAEPHDYEITSNDFYNIKNSNLLVLTGSLEPWSAKIRENLINTNTKVLAVGDMVSDKKDPHFWLNPQEFSLVVDGLTEVFLALDPKNGSSYTQNSVFLKNKLQALDIKFEKELFRCQTRDFVTSHNAFGYLAKRYNLRQVSIAGISPDEEPSLKQLAEVSSFAKQNGVKYIFFESLLSPKLSDTIAKEVGAKTLVLNPLEGLSQGEINSGLDYISIMESNLANLKIALQCP